MPHASATCEMRNGMNIRQMNSNYFSSNIYGRIATNMMSCPLCPQICNGTDYNVLLYATKEQLSVTCLSIPISNIRMCKFSFTCVTMQILSPQRWNLQSYQTALGHTLNNGLVKCSGKLNLN